MLTEVEILDCLGTSLMLAADRCKQIAQQPRSARNFTEMRASLKLAEGAARQAAHWRGDIRWLRPAIYLEQAHQLARTWLHRPSVESKKLFTGLSSALLQMAKDLLRLENMATGSSGLILTPYSGSNPLSKIAGKTRIPVGLHLPAGA
ncbi:MAG: hypothetical protein WCP82_04550 [Alphaproteobacteria bacterium]